MARATLHVRPVNGPASLHELDPGRVVTIGRHRENTVVLDDQHASRRHAELYWDGQYWMLRGHEALNGTYRNGSRVTAETPMQSGDVLVIGDTHLDFVVPDGAVARYEAPTPKGTRLVGAGECAAAGATGARATGARAAGAEDNLSTDSLPMDDLSALCRFMQASLREPSPRELVLHALTAALRQTGASAAGYLGFDQDDPLPRLVMPALARVDIHLSRQLTRRLREENRLIWLAAEKAESPESIGAFQDALCLPLPGPDGQPSGAVHVYRSGGVFRDRHVRFCQVLAGSLAHALQVLRVRRQLEADNSRLRFRASAGGDQLIGDSPALDRLRDTISLVGRGPATILIHGESGVGKELVALGLHRQSRRQGPLVIVNCAAIPGSLLESELFGHKKGAFTSATEDRRGLFEQADEGTLFFDEIGELSAECQAKLLRVIEGRGFRPVGGNEDIHVDVRILAATNRDLEQEVRAGRFRQDLYFRLSIPIRVPTLREHAEDIPALVDHFLGRLTVEYHKRVTLTEGARRRLCEYSWPGNVRQLRSVLETAVAMARGTVIDAADLPLGPSLLPALAPALGPAPEPAAGKAPARKPAEAAETLTLNLDELEEQAIREALRRTGGNKVQAARLLGIHRDTLLTKLKKMETGRKEG